MTTTEIQTRTAAQRHADLMRQLRAQTAAAIAAGTARIVDHR